MKTLVNLYHSSCYPKREKATFEQFLVLFLICCLASLASYLLVNHQIDSLNKQVLSHKVLLSDKQLELSDLVVKLQKNRAPEAKLNLHSRLQTEIKSKQHLIANLAGIEVKDLLHFSSLMRGLSYADMPDLSIKQFSMVGGTLDIHGNAKQSDSVPIWLSNIQLTSELSGVAFKSLSIEEERDFFTFQLTNSDLKGKNNE